METVYYGHGGYRQFWRNWLDAFKDIRWDPEEILDFGEKALVTAQHSGHGSGSGIAVSEPVFQLFTFRRGLVIRQEDFSSRSKALEAAGLLE
jgi:SnoaL-like domain